VSPRARIVLALLLLLAAGVRLRYFSGLQVGDDIVYSSIAAQRIQGEFHVSNVHEARQGFLLPVTLFYALFGPGEYSLLLYNLLCSIGLVAAVYFLARRFWGDTAGALSGVVAVLHPNLVFFATECHTDTPVALWQAAAVLALLSAADSEPSRSKRILAGLLVGWAWLHKEHAVFLIPFFAGHWIATKRRWTWYLPVALPALGVFLAETAVYAAVAGNPFHRFALIRSMHVGHYMAAQYTTTPALLHRLFIELPLLLFTPRSGHHWEGLVNLAGAVGVALLLIRRERGARMLAGWWASIFLCYSFWPSSLHPYLPSFLLHDWTLPPLAAPLLCGLGGAASRGRRDMAVAGVLLLAGVSLRTIHSSWENGLKFAGGGKEAHVWLDREWPSRVIADDKTIEVLDFLDHHRRVRTYTSFQEAREYPGAVVIVDKFWTEPDRWWSRPISEAAKRPPAAWKKVYESGRLTVYQP
jgi:hypothetical protein